MSANLKGATNGFLNDASLDRYVAMLRDLCHKTAGIRRLGSTALDLAYVASGRQMPARSPRSLGL